MFLFFDTETTGLPRSHSAPASDVANWPRMVQIAWVLADPHGRELTTRAHVVKPAGFTIPREAANIHGITTDLALREGVDLGAVLAEFSADLKRSVNLVAHNIDFDSRVVSAEYFRMGVRASPLDGKPHQCTMRTSTQFCRLPGGPRGFKWPTLQELHLRLFGSEFGEAHNAAADVRACAKCYFELRRRGVINASAD